MLGAILGGLGGSLISGLFADKAARDTRSWQEKLSSSAHQREVADLKAAGLNPILSAGGRGASTPSGATAQVPDAGRSFSSAFANATQKKLMVANVANTNAIAASNTVDARLKEKMLDLSERSPFVEDAVAGGMLAKQAGIPSVAGAIVGSNASAAAAARMRGKKNRLGRRLREVDKKVESYYPKVDLKSSPQYRPF